MKDHLRAQILLILDQHSRSGSSEFKSDKDLAKETTQELKEIQRQLDILESRELVTLAKTMGPTYGARITPEGLLAIEQMQDAARQQPSRPIGFRPNG